MKKTLAMLALLATVALGGAGCAAQSADSGEQSTAIQQAHEALSLKPKGLYPLSAEATQLADGRTILDVALTAIPRPIEQSDEIPLHDTGDFKVLLVYVDRADGRRDYINAYAGQALNQIGPGGGCVHVFINAQAGDRLYIGGVVKLADVQYAQLAATDAPVTVQQGEWQFATLPDHTLPAP